MGLDTAMGGFIVSRETVRAALESCIAGVQEDPQNAKVVFTARTRLEEGLRTTSKVRHFPEMTVDEPPSFGGTDKGISPAEVLLTALGTCQEIMYSAYASVMNIELDELEVICHADLDLHGMLALDESVPSGFTEIRFETRIKSQESPDRIRELVDMAQSHCPLLDTIIRPVQVLGKAYLNGALISNLDALETAVE